MPALLFGSISAVADTSELQRAAFNEAFRQHELSWDWQQDEYRALLTGNGGRARIADYAHARGEEVDAAAVHRTKSEIFRAKLTTIPVRPRPGVVDSIAAARAAGWQVGLVTTTSADNVSGLLDALEGHLDRENFDIVVDASLVDQPKPAPDAYRYALDKLGVDAGDSIAVEDNVGGARAAQAAGIRCVAFPNENTVLHDFGAAPVSHHLEFADLEAAVAGK